jgi:hypothetical protein
VTDFQSSRLFLGSHENLQYSREPDRNPSKT